MQGFYALFLGLWVGAMVMLAVAAGLTFKTVREYSPIITTQPYNQRPISEHPAMLAGAVVGNVLQGLAVICGVCAVVVAVCLVLQYTCFRDRLESAGNSWLGAVRIVLLALPMAVLVWNVAYLTPEIHRERAVMYGGTGPKSGSLLDRAQASDVDGRTHARERFDRLHKLSERVVGTSVLMLAIAGLISPFAFTVSTEKKA